MKKISKLMTAALIALASFVPALAGTLTLYNYESETYFVPINSMWFDTPGNTTQVLYPATDLTDMVGKEIKAITFYTDEDGVKMNGGSLDIYMGETSVSVMTDYVDGLTLVGTVSLTQSAETELTLTFDTPYLYQGGNLVFGNVVKTAGNMTMTYFGGQEVNYNNCVFYGAGGSNSSSSCPRLPLPMVVMNPLRLLLTRLWVLDPFLVATGTPKTPATTWFWTRQPASTAGIRKT